jgi:hypothetical protein
MLLPYTRVQRFLDSVTNLKSSIALKVNISDTAAMMLAAPRVQRFLDSVTNLKTSINLKLNKSDTASMLTPYLRKTDTTAKFITSVFRKVASDSVFFVKGGANTFAFKDSTGGGGVGSQNLQQVTDISAYTTNPITANSFNSPTSDRVGGSVKFVANSEDGFRITNEVGRPFMSMSSFSSLLLNGSNVNSGHFIQSITTTPTYNYLTLPLKDGTFALTNDTVSLSNRINLTLLKSDTASMLTPYLRKADTTGKFITSVFRKVASDSVFFVKGGANTFAFKDSIGSGGGGGSTNIYNTDGSLTGARTLTLNSQPLYLAGTTTSTFFANGRMTIGGTTDAGYRLDIIGEDARINGLRIGKGNGQIASNMAFGTTALNANTSGTFNIGIGLNALAVVTTAVSNTALGADAAKLSTANRCTVIGNKAMQEANSGDDQTFVGYQAGKGGSGVSNVGVGAQAMLLNTGGGGNTGIGAQALQSNINNSHSTGVGFQALNSNTGAQNSAVGSQVLWANTTGANNVAMGYNAGRFITGGSTTATAVDNSILIGYGVKVAGNTQTNQIVIGYDATGLGSNTTLIGNSSTTTTGLYGNIRLVSGMATAPASATAAGTLGDIRITSGFIYVCTATNVWVRSALTTW